MKKFFLIVAVLCVSLIQNICSARIDVSKMYIGGLNLKSTISDAVRIYGEPTKITKTDIRWLGPSKTKPKVLPQLSHYHLGDGSFEITEYPNGILEQILVTANNGIKTADEVGVGMDKKILTEIYGKPDNVYRVEVIEYHSYYPFLGTGSQTIPLVFGIKNGKIISISIHSEV